MSLKRPAVSIILTIFFLSRLTAGEFYVTGVRQYKDAGRQAYEITINNAIVIKDISIFGEGREPLIKLPEYVSQKKRVYPQLILSTKKAQRSPKGRPGK